ncbi:MAG TPA: ribosome silencing factor [Pseudohaliea sp.]|nr:ribosome silencing factor [Pseudohaliea sp.]
MQSQQTESPERLRDLAVAALEDVKGQNLVVLDVRGRTSITDFMVLATGNSRRQVKALAESVVEAAREAGYRPLGVEGAEVAEWILVDLGDVLVHVMQPQVREFYRLENVWAMDDAEEEAPERARHGA